MPPRRKLSHVSSNGDVRMVSVAEKKVTFRTAEAMAFVSCGRDALRAIASAKKGDVLATVRIAAIMAAKKTPELIPLCHPLPISHASVDVRREEGGVRIVARVETHSRTGVEMEALTAASVGALTFYDMLKSVDREMQIEVRLLEKRGGSSGDFLPTTSKARR